MDTKSLENLPILKNIYLEPDEIIKRAHLFCKISKRLGKEPNKFAKELIQELNNFLDDFFEPVLDKEAQEGVAGAAASTGFALTRLGLMTIIFVAPLTAAAAMGYMLARSKEVNVDELDKYVQANIDITNLDRLYDELKRIRKTKKET